MLAGLVSSNNTQGMSLELKCPRCKVLRIDHAGTSEGGVVFYFRDITHETKVDRMKSEFLTKAAHELRTPMVSIFGFTDLLLKRNYRLNARQTCFRPSTGSPGCSST